MITNEAIEAMLPEGAFGPARDAFRAGVMIGLANARSILERNESDVVEEIRKSLRQISNLTDAPGFTDGIEAGINLKIDAERASAKLAKFLYLIVPPGLLRRALASPSRTKEFIQGLHSTIRQLVRPTFSARFGVSTEEAFRGAFRKDRADEFENLLGPSTAESESLREGDQGGPDSYLLTAETLSSALHTGKPWLGRLLVGSGDSLRSQVIEEYESRYGSLAIAIARKYRGVEREIMEDLLRDGRVSWSKLLYFCVVGVGTDEEGLRELFEEIQPEQLESARREFRAIWSDRAPWYERFLPSWFGELERRIWLETGGDSWFDLKEYFGPRSLAAHGAFEKVSNLHRHERSGYLLQRFQYLSKTTMMMNSDIRAVAAFYRSFSEHLESDEATAIRFNALIRFAELDLELFREMKHQIGNHATNIVAAMTVALSVFALTSQRLNLTSVMVITGFVSILCRLILKTMLKGRGYHRGEILADIFFGTFDGVTLFATHLFRQALIQFGMKTVTKLGVTNGIAHLSRRIGKRTEGWGVRYRDLAGRR